MGFIDDNFLLYSEAARRLYHEYAASEPILDYHSHLSAADIATDRQLENLFEIWLEGDHYKWRAMRANGVDEHYCTGEATPYEKFLAWARTVPFTLRNPLYHWTHLELKRYFQIDVLLNESSAKFVWETCNSVLESGNLTARKILKKFGVRVLCTTDDPSDDLSWHQKIAAAEAAFRVYPTFRPDHAYAIQVPGEFQAWVGRLERASNKNVESLQDFLDTLKQRHDFFHANGARLSDHGLTYCYSEPCTERQAAAIFDNVRAGRAASPQEQAAFSFFLLMFFGYLDAEKGWTKQLHLGAFRNANTRRRQQLGPDTGFDSIGDGRQVEALCRYLDHLDQEAALPKMILYNSNPADNYAFATAIGNFQDGSIAGKIQFGSGWWFLDQKEAVEWQLNALSSTGLLSRFVGMVTDSRSFMSFPRHEYFRRVLCNLVGREMDNGELPNDELLMGELIRNVCFANARQYLGLAMPTGADETEPLRH
jgi:glucuronate isomerase